MITGTRREKTADIMTVAENVVFSAKKFENFQKTTRLPRVFPDSI